MEIIMILSIDIGGTYIKYGFVEGSEVKNRGKFPTVFTFSDLCEKLDSLVTEDVERIAISSGGFWSDNGESIGYETIGETKDNNLVEYLSRKHNLPVTILNDARCALLCEREYGALRGKESGVVMVLGSSVGCAVMLGGKLYRGRNKKAGMLFKMPERVVPYIYEDNANTVNLAEKYLQGKKKDGFTIKEIGEKAAKGEAAACEYIDSYSEAVALKILYAKLMYDPEIMAVGGGISKNNYLIENIVNSYRQLLSECGEPDDMEIVKTSFGEHSNLIGAALYGINND